MSWFHLLMATSRWRAGLMQARVSLALAVAGLFSIPFRPGFGGLLTVVGIGLAVVGLIWERARLSQETARVRIVPDPTVDYARLIDPSVTARHGSEVLYFSRELNSRLATRSPGQCEAGCPEAPGERVPAGLDGSPLVLNHILADHRQQILLHRYRDAAIRPFNGDIICQATTLETSLADETVPVVFRPARYFDLLVSNYMVGSNIYSQNEELILRAGQLITDDAGKLRSLDDSGLANAVGVSTIAFDRNNRLILVAQSEAALSSPGLWAPSGSGSLEPRDFRPQVRRTATTQSLATAILAGMNRELAEEANVDYSAIKWSTVLGYFRWLDKGGKPEYVGVTRLHPTTDELRRVQRRVERRWVTKILVDVRVDFDALRDHPDRPQDALSLQAGTLIQLSTPLYAALRALGDRLADPAFAREFTRS
jgi:hypothetical protein